MLAVPSLLLSACMAAIIVVPFRVIALSAWGWETDIALHCLCATVSWAASMVSSCALTKRRIYCLLTSCRVFQWSGANSQIAQ